MCPLGVPVSAALFLFLMTVPKPCLSQCQKFLVLGRPATPWPTFQGRHKRPLPAFSFGFFSGNQEGLVWGGIPNPTCVHISILPQPSLDSPVRILCNESQRSFSVHLDFPDCLICMYLLFQVGNRDDSNLYINVKLKAAEEVRRAQQCCHPRLTPGPACSPCHLCPCP